MKKKLLLTSAFCSIAGISLFAQAWDINGNNINQVGKLGTISNRNVQFISTNLVRGVLTKDGAWGFGTTTPNTRVHINSDAGENPFRVQVNGLSKLYVDNGGGVSVGSSAIPPANGLFVSGNTGIGTSVPVTKLQVAGGSDASLTGNGFLVLGSTAGANIVIDDNEIIARNNGGTSTLFLNNDGGNLSVNGGNNTGNLGIGLSAPANRLHVVQDVANRAIEWQHESTADFWTLGIGTSTLNARFEFNGTGKGQIASSDGAYSQISDERLKQDIKPLPSVLNKVMQLKPSEYYFKDAKANAKNKSIGFIAQDVEKVFPQVVRDEDKGYKWLSYADFSVIAIKAIQELQPKIEEQNATIAALQQRISQLENMVSALTNKSNVNPVADAVLEQNQPNPFNQTTTIRYRIPQSTIGQINIYDNKGILMKSFRTNDSGQAIINASDLKPGTYTYTLSVNGKLAATKKLVLIY